MYKANTRTVHPKQFSKLRKLVRLHPYRSLFDITYTDIDPIWVGTLPSFAQGWGGPILVQGQAGDTTKHSNYNRDLSKIMLTQMPAISGSPPMQRWVPRIPVAPEVAVGELAAQDHGSAFLQPDEEYDVHSLQARLDDARDANMIFGIPIPDQLLEFEKQQAALGNASATAAEGGPFFNPALVEYYQQYDAVGRHANDALGAQESSLDQAMPDAVAPANYGAFAYRAGDEDMDLGEYVGDHDYIIDRYVDEEIGVTEEDILRGYGYVSANESENWIPRSAHI